MSTGLSTGPLRRITGMVGLVALIPIAVMQIIGILTPEQAAIRAIAVVGAVLLVGNIVRVILTSMLSRVERREQAAAEEAAKGDTKPGDRRRAA